MADTTKTSDPLSRAAVKQLAWLGIVAVVGFVALMGVLSWASRVTGAGMDTVGAVDEETGTREMRRLANGQTASPTHWCSDNAR